MGRLITFLPASSSTDHDCSISSSDHKPPPPSSSASASKPRKSTKQPTTKHKQKQVQLQLKQQQQPSSWDQFKNLLTCKQMAASLVHDPSKPKPKPTPIALSSCHPSYKVCASMCSFRDVVHGNTRVVHRADNSPESSSLGRQEARNAGARSHVTSSSRGLPLRKLSGCYECRMIDPTRYPIAPRATVCACSKCGEIFPKIESLEHHQAVMHAVSELGPEDSGRNIVEIIFKSSWMMMRTRTTTDSLCKIERILKVHNSQHTLQRFEECREAVKLLRSNKNPRCAADGNELLRFHCTTLACSLGSRGSSSLCTLLPACGVCTLIRHGFQGSKGVRTTASSGRAHDILGCPDGRRAMLVCRVIAGRVKHTPPEEDEHPPPEPALSVSASAYDSVAPPTAAAYSNLEDLVVFNPRAILPCFVVIYKTLSI